MNRNLFKLMTDDNTELSKDDQNGLTLEGRDPDDVDPAVCRGCGRKVTLMGNGYCGVCQDQADDDQDGGGGSDGGE